MNVIERSEGRYYVESRSADWRHVKRVGKDTYTCDCPYGMFTEKECAHVRAVKSR